MRFKGFVGGAYNLRNVQYDCQRTINWYPEVNELGLGKEGDPAQLVPTPGLVPLIENLDGPSRGGYVASNGACYWVFGNTLYKIGGPAGSTDAFASLDPGAWGASRIFRHVAGASQCFFTDNGVDLFVLGDGHGYAINLTTGEPYNMTGGAWAASSSMAYYDTYIVFSQNNSNRFFWTNLLSTETPALNFASAEANPDRIVGLINNADDLWIFGKKVTEIWYNYGSNGITFARRPASSGIVETGCASALTIQKLNNTIFWLAEDDRGGPMLMMANGITPTRVSTYAIEQQWMRESAGQFNRATAFTYQSGGHYFYCLNIPGQSSTWVYDASVSAQLGQPTWHERQSFNPTSSVQQRWNAEGHAYFRSVHLTGDIATGTLYAMSEASYTDNGQHIMRQRTTPHISNAMDRVFYACLTVDALTGSSTDADLTPQIQLEFSDDGGFTWSEPRFESPGLMGQYGIKVQFQRLGSARSRVFRVTVTDPLYWAISGADIELRPGIH